MTIKTHYDNLKVSHNAPPEVIKAAYKTLAQKYHPDLNPGSEQAARIMVMLNQAYAVLSDSVRRKEHDEWIAEQERVAAKRTTTSDGYSSYARSGAEAMRSAYGADIPPSQTDRNWQRSNRQETYTPRPPPPSPPPPAQPPTAAPPVAAKPVSAGLGGWGWVFIVGAVIWLTVNSEKFMSTAPARAAPTQQPAAKPPSYVRPALAPSGYAWPVSAAYVEGFPALNQSGRSTFTIDNTRGGGDVFVKIHSLTGRNAGQNVRHMFIPQGEQFTARKLTAGWYDIRYRYLSDGTLRSSEMFEVTETANGDTTYFSNLSLTLYTVAGGNTATKALAEADF